jgi:hypothetical protein
VLDTTDLSNTFPVLDKLKTKNKSKETKKKLISKTPEKNQANHTNKVLPSELSYKSRY